MGPVSPPFIFILLHAQKFTRILRQQGVDEKQYVIETAWP